MSAQADDKPRWGDYQDKLELPYLEGLIQNGEWFDGTKTWTFSRDTTRKNYAPKYMMNHYDKFKYLLEPLVEIQNDQARNYEIAKDLILCLITFTLCKA